MSDLLAIRVRWCSDVGSRLFGGPPVVPQMLAWGEMLRDPASSSASLWAGVVDGAGQGDESSGAMNRKGQDASWASNAWGRAQTSADSLAVPPVPRSLHDRVAQQEPVSSQMAAALRRHSVPSGSRGARELRDYTADLPLMDRIPARTRLPVESPIHPGAAAAASRPSSPLAHVGALATNGERQASLAPASDSRHFGAPAATSSVTDEEVRLAKVAPVNALPLRTATRLVQGAAGLGRLLSVVRSDAGNDTSSNHPTDRIRRMVEPGHVAVSSVRSPLPVPPTAGSVAFTPASLSPLDAVPALLPTGPRAPTELDVDAVLEAMVERLRVDFLRHYGSAPV